MFLGEFRRFPDEPHLLCHGNQVEFTAYEQARVDVCRQLLPVLNSSGSPAVVGRDSNDSESSIPLGPYLLLRQLTSHLAVDIVFTRRYDSASLQ